MRGFKVSRDPQFVDKLEDIVGLYMSPPEHALVLCCDEKSQVQALDRTQPGLPLKKGRAQTMTHDYKRHGTTTLFAALNVLDGQVIGQCQQRHTHAEWLKFLRKIDRETPKGKTLHLIADNYATHKHPAVQEWLAKHPRFHMHFRPTSASWLNMVERFFRDITTERLRPRVMARCQGPAHQEKKRVVISLHSTDYFGLLLDVGDFGLPQNRALAMIVEQLQEDFSTLLWPLLPDYRDYIIPYTRSRLEWFAENWGSLDPKLLAAKSTAARFEVVSLMKITGQHEPWDRIGLAEMDQALPITGIGRPSTSLP